MEHGILGIVFAYFKKDEVFKVNKKLGYYNAVESIFKNKSIH